MVGRWEGMLENVPTTHCLVNLRDEDIPSSGSGLGAIVVWVIKKKILQ